MPDRGAFESPTAGHDGAASSTVSVVSCSRLGRTANPPTFSLTGWLRPRRRRGVSGA